jgi:hypothetical protein
MSDNPNISPTNQKDWTNRHETFVQPIDNLYDCSNGETADPLQDYNNTTTAVMQFLSHSVKDNKRIRGLGGGWSLSKVAATEGRMINTKMMNLVFDVNPASISPSYTGDAAHVLFAQGGNSILELHTKLNARKRSLKTCGASNGQTLIGAISTGTHGSAFDFGGTENFVVGLHLVVGEQRHIWLERASYPVVADTFVTKLGASPVRDDDLFNAALVSFGSFGFVLGAMIETEDIFLLQCFRRRVPIDATLKQLLQTLDFTNSGMPKGSEHPFHFQTLINQYDLANGAYVSTMYKNPFAPYQPTVVDPNKAGPGDGSAEFLGELFDAIPAAVPDAVNLLIKSQYPPYENQWGTLGEIFCTTTFRGKLMSAAMGVPLEAINTVNDLLLKVNQTAGPFSGVFAYRFVKQTKAMLGFTCFPVTCVVELDGVYSETTLAFYNAVWNALDQSGIPYTFHWGKINNLTSDKIRKMYGANRDKWLDARHRLLSPDFLRLFSNQLLEDWGLNS